MADMTRIGLFPGVSLTAVHTKKFKSSVLGVQFLSPLSAETASANALVPSVLRRGTARHLDMEALSAALDELYGGSIEPVVRTRGETQCVGFLGSFLDDAYTLDGSPVLEQAAALLGELLLEPYTEHGVFCPDYTAGERANLIDRIRAQINEKRSYAVKRLKTQTRMLPFDRNCSAIDPPTVCHPFAFVGIRIGHRIFDHSVAFQYLINVLSTCYRVFFGCGILRYPVQLRKPEQRYVGVISLHRPFHDCLLHNFRFVPCVDFCI